jgi:hypothetical protein
MQHVVPSPLTILALDPSTEITGAVIVQFNPSHLLGTTDRLLLHADAWDARHAEELGTLARRDTLESAIARIRWTRSHLAHFVRSSVAAFDVLAFEGHTGRGAGSTTLDMAFGAYLCLSHFTSFVPVMVTRQDACIAIGAHDIYRQPSGKTNPEREAKKKRLKAAVVSWALGAYQTVPKGVHFPDTGYGGHLEAVSDALAVAEAVYAAHCKAECAKAEVALQKALRLPKGGKA